MSDSEREDTNVRELKFEDSPEHVDKPSILKKRQTAAGIGNPSFDNTIELDDHATTNNKKVRI